MENNYLVIAVCAECGCSRMIEVEPRVFHKELFGKTTAYETCDRCFEDYNIRRKNNENYLQI